MEKDNFIIFKTFKNKKKKRKSYNNYKILILFICNSFIIFTIIILIYIYKLNNKNKKLTIENEILTNENNKEYKLYNLLCPKEVIGKTKVLFGDYGDGGYILLDDLENIKIAYSFGISNLISFDKALADKGIEVYMYDHTINKLKFENPRFHWKKLGVTSESKKKYNMKTLNELIIENGHEKEKNMILKMDIEESEWDVLSEISEETLNQFKYILMELHFRDINKYQVYYDGVKKLVKNHQAYHIHCSNCGGLFEIGNNPICSGFEIFFIQKEKYKFRKDNSIYPIKGFDFQTCPHLPHSNKEQNILKYCNNN